MRITPAGGRGRRTWPQKLLLSLNIGLIFAALVTAGGLAYAYDKLGNLPRVSFDEGILANTADEGPTEAVNVLLVGTDSSVGLDPDDPIQIGRNPTSQLADAIMVLRLDPRTGDAALLSIPRDLWVPIAGTTTSDKINVAYSVGGAPALIETITSELGIPIHHFVAVDFAGFQQVVAAIGGVNVYFPEPARDLGSGLNIEEPGCHFLDQHAALEYVRARHLETFQNGRWVGDRQYDFGRMRRQQTFIQLALSEAINRGARNPATLNALINAVDDAVILDDQLTTKMVLDIANAFRMFNPDSLNRYGFQDYVYDDWKGGQMVLVLRQQDAGPLLDLFRGFEQPQSPDDPPSPDATIDPDQSPGSVPPADTTTSTTSTVPAETEPPPQC